MSLGSELEKVFIELTSGGEFQEAELFTKLQDSFILLKGRSTANYSVDIIHGSRSMVEFVPKESWIVSKTGKYTICTTSSKFKKCELSDMFFVVYDVKKNECRIFFMQAKNAEIQIDEKFEADLIQLDLLHNRSPFTSVGTINGNILAAAKAFSITTYGVFYREVGNYNMKIYVSEFLQPITATGKCRERVVTFNENHDDIRTFSICGRNFEEYKGLKCIKRFGDGIEDMKIGQPIGPSMKKIIENTFHDAPEKFKELEIRNINNEQVDSDQNEKMISTTNVIFIGINDDATFGDEN